MPSGFASDDDNLKTAFAQQSVYSRYRQGEPDDYFSANFMRAVMFAYPTVDNQIRRVRKKMRNELRPNEPDLWAEMFRDPRVQDSWAETVKYMRDEDNPFYATFGAKFERAKQQTREERERYVEGIKSVLGGKNIHLTNQEVQQLHEMESNAVPSMELALSTTSHEKFVEAAGLVNGGPRGNGSGKD